MAPEKKTRTSSKMSTPGPNRQHRKNENGIASNFNASYDNTVNIPSNDIDFQHPSKVDYLEPTQQNTPASPGTQGSASTTFHKISRPWPQNAINYGTSTAANLTIPIEQVAYNDTHYWHTSHSSWSQDDVYLSTSAATHEVPSQLQSTDLTIPMQRWMQQTTVQEPWHPIDGYYTYCDVNQDTLNIQHDAENMSGGETDFYGMQEEVEDDDSMVCNASDADGA